MKSVTLTTDGACQPNPGRGGWAAILRFGSSFRELTGSHPNTTNNRMEFTAVIEGLRVLKEPCRVLVRTDSKTCLAWCSPKAFLKQSAIRKHPLVYPLVLQFREVSKQHVLSFEWVRGHCGDRDNERCDQLAEDQCRRPF